ncbi:DUF2188 domain-containing protein [Desulfovibrio sp. UIB00]|uniref:DUF2188 domain-containing protein n=1 Tax=Desulfovibrio sp. UIB00 TaxID=2804314 RepID=UPI001F1183CF|nr:DUF2188 domain-containing protein [Desulfovibrio sp. UIB00]MCH5144105.1 DUF2188 domain-containing protein [Desulfovibrio sp. UIB00]
MASDQTHIVPNPNGGWDSKDTGNSRASKHFDRKADAQDWGRDHSRNIGSEFVIHDKKGVIRQKDSHGNDPCPPRDKR